MPRKTKLSRDAISDALHYILPAVDEAEKHKRRDGYPQRLYWQGKADALRVVMALLSGDTDTAKYWEGEQANETGLDFIVSDYNKTTGRK